MTDRTSAGRQGSGSQPSQPPASSPGASPGSSVDETVVIVTMRPELDEAETLRFLEALRDLLKQRGLDVRVEGRRAK